MAPRASAANLDFSNVKEAGNFNTKRVPAGDYLAKIMKVEDSPSKKDDTPQWLFTIKLTKFSQNAYPYYCKLQENQLWKLRNLFIAAGMNVPKKRIKLDPNRIVGKLIGVTMEDDEYEGKEKSVIAAVFPAAELADGAVTEDDDDEATTVDDDGDDAEDLDEADEAEDTEEEEAEEEAEDEEEDETEVSPYADYDRSRLKREIKKIDPSYSVKRAQTDDDLRAVLAELAAGGDDEDEEEEEEEAPKPAPKKKTKAKAKKPAADISDDELEELDLDDL